MAGPIPMKCSGDVQIGLAGDAVNFGSDRINVISVLETKVNMSNSHCIRRLQAIVLGLILLSLLITLSLGIREHSRGKFSNLIRKGRPVKILTNDSKQCFCNFQNPTSIPVLEKLKNNGVNWKRLVVYLYKNPTSNEIKLFVPNNEKQEMIPDLSFDEGDRLVTPTSDNLQTLFTKYPNLVTKRKPARSSNRQEFIHPIRYIPKINEPSLEDIIIPYEDNILNDNKKPPSPKNTRNPKHTDSDSDQIKHHNLNIDLNHEMQPYFEYHADKPESPINLISVNINRKKADPNDVNDGFIRYPENFVRFIGPNRDRLNTNLDSNQDLQDVVVDYPEDSEIEEISMTPDDDMFADDGTGDDINEPDPEVTIAEQDFKDMPPELTDEMTNIDESTPKSVRKILRPLINEKEKYTPSENPNKPMIETHTVPTELSSTDTSPPTAIPGDVNIQIIKPVGFEIPIQDLEDSIKLNTDINEETVPVVENESILQPDLPSGDKQQPIELENQQRPTLEDDTNNYNVLPNADPTYDLIDYNIQAPHLIVAPNVKPKAREELTPISMNVQKKLLDTLLPGHEFMKPIDYIKNDVFRNQHLIPGDLSIFSVNPETLIKKYQSVNGIDFQDTFDNWFDQQMKRVRFINSRASNSIDIYTLKYLIEKTLHEKGMFVTQKGYIIDSDGHILKTANLGLRPILIGNSVEYKNLLQGRFSTFKLPMDMPYLEAVLITSIDPPKILGIIPLGKTYLPKTIQKPLPYFMDDEIMRNGCGGVCNMRNMLVPSLNSRRHRGQAYVGLKPIKTRVTHKHQQGIHRSRPFTRRIFPFDPINSFIDKVYRVPLRETEVVRRPSAYVVNYETGPIITREPVIKYPIAVSEVTPGFRIIGGNPATSSGTPVSSKGRSGYDSMESALSPIDNDN